MRVHALTVSEFSMTLLCPVRSLALNHAMGTTSTTIAEDNRSFV